MNNLRVLLVDDDPLCLKELKTLLSSFPYITVVGESLNTSNAISLLHRQKADLIFLDIELGNESGFRLARHIHQAFPGCKVIFLTGHVNFALEGYVDFLVKPVNVLRLEQALLRVQEQRTPVLEKEEVRIGIQSGNRLEIVNIGSILYMEKRTVRWCWCAKMGKPLSPGRPCKSWSLLFCPMDFIAAISLF